MGNRAIEAKKLKIKKYKRLAPKKYYADQVTVHMPRKPEFFGNPRTLYMAGTSSHQEATLRARALHMLSMYPSFCVNPFTGENYKDNVPRQQVKDLVYGKIVRENIAFTVMDEDIPVEMCVLFEKTKHRRLVFYTNVGHTKNYFVKTDTIANLMWRSKTYGSRERAMIAHRYQTIEWGKPIEGLPPSAGPSPSG